MFIDGRKIKGVSSYGIYSNKEKKHYFFECSYNDNAVLLALRAWFIVKGIKSIIHNFKDSDAIRLLSKLPSDYYLFNDVKMKTTQLTTSWFVPRAYLP